MIEVRPASRRRSASWISSSVSLSTLEVDLKQLAMGTTTTVKWRGKPVFIRRRSQKEIAAAAADDTAELKHQETDAERASNPEWLVVLGVCTHLGCVPISNAGDYGGWFCPCHGSHYDTSGRIRKGPAPENLPVPEYQYLSDTKIRIG